MLPLSQRTTTVLLAVALLVALGLNIFRIVLQYDDVRGIYDNRYIGLFDFHNGVYTPTRAYLDGVNPYGQIILDRGYPVSRPAPIYGPSHFLIHAPLALLKVRFAEIVYVIFNLLLYSLILWIPLKDLRDLRKSRLLQDNHDLINFFLLGLTLLLLSRPGHVTFVSGYFTAELAFGSIAVLWLAPRRPILAGLFFVLVCGKPTYALPVLFVLAIAGYYRSLLSCLWIGGLVNALAIGWLLRSASLNELIAGIREGQAAHMADPIELPVNSWLRIDWTAIVAKWLNADPPELTQVIVMSLLYVIVGYAFRKSIAAEDASSSKVTISSPIRTVTLASVLLFVYHHAYDALLLTPALVAISVASKDWTGIFSKTERWMVFVLISCPFWNYFGSETFLARLPDWIYLRHTLTSLNTIAVTSGLAWLVFRLSQRQKLRQRLT